MTACFKIMRTFEATARQMRPERLCAACVYFSRNLDTREYPVLLQEKDQCVLGYLPGDSGCAEMRTDSCSIRKRPD